MIVRILELVGVLLAVGFLVTQVAIPGLFGQPLMPLFRGERRAKQRLAEAEEQRRIAQTERQTDREYRRAGIDRGKKRS